MKAEPNLYMNDISKLRYILYNLLIDIEWEIFWIDYEFWPNRDTNPIVKYHWDHDSRFLLFFFDMHLSQIDMTYDMTESALKRNHKLSLAIVIEDEIDFKSNVFFSIIQLMHHIHRDQSNSSDSMIERFAQNSKSNLISKFGSHSDLDPEYLISFVIY